MSAVASGLIGGAIATALTTYIAGKVGRSGAPGQLRFGAFMWGLSIACLLMASIPIAITLFAGDHTDFWVKFGLFAWFGFGAAYCFGEALFVRGTFNAHEIRFSTPWSGTKVERWSDIESVVKNDWGNWYTLKFKSGSRIRLSQYLGNHLFAIQRAKEHVVLRR